MCQDGKKKQKRKHSQSSTRASKSKNKDNTQQLPAAANEFNHSMAFFQQMVISMLTRPRIFVATHDYFQKMCSHIAGSKEVI